MTSKLEQTINEGYHIETIDRIIKYIENQYIEEERIEEIVERLTHFKQSGLSQENSSSIEKYIKFLTKKLKEITNDLHFGVFKSKNFADEGQEFSMDKYITHLKRNSYDIKKFEFLPGNIVYFRFDMFHRLDFYRDKMEHFMDMMKGSSGIIFDMRYNGGGDPSTIQFILSYLFEEKRHINSFYRRTTDEYVESWTLDDIDEYYSQPVYVLTSEYTGSAAEEFAYDLKVMERATLVGTTTAGAAHPVMTVKLNDDLGMYLPDGKPINPITETNWEKVGVKPHIEESSKNALQKAHILCLEELIEFAKDQSSQEHFTLVLSELNKTNHVD